jgi:hypothetical protein
MSSQAYTPGLKRKEHSLIRKVRRLPIKGDILVKDGDVVSQDTTIAVTDVQGDPHLISVATELDLPLEDGGGIEGYMLKKKGDRVKKDELIAFKQSFFGLLKKEVRSPTAGTLVFFSDVTGQAVIEAPPNRVELKAYIPGIVVEVIPSEGVVVETYGAFIQGIFGIGGETHGELTMVAKNPEDTLTAEQITAEHSGKVIVGGALVTGAAIRKAVQEGVKGIVVGGITYEDLQDFLGYTIGVAITGNEEKGITLIITEGFGKMKMLEKTFELLKKFSGSLACINGATQIRAGVMRPEVIIPRKLTDSKKSSQTESVNEGITIGTHVRLIRQPNFGAIGTVVKLPVELQVVETESPVRVLTVKLENGKQVTVPRANVEIIEE